MKAFIYLFFFNFLCVLEYKKLIEPAVKLSGIFVVYVQNDFEK